MVQLGQDDDARWDDEPADDEGPLDADLEEGDGGDEENSLICPSCRGDVHEETQQCPHCGDWITPVENGGTAKRWIWIVAAVLLVLLLSGVLWL